MSVESVVLPAITADTPAFVSPLDCPFLSRQPDSEGSELPSNYSIDDHPQASQVALLLWIGSLE